MRRFLINSIKLAIIQDKAQAKLNAIIGKKKGMIKVKIPIDYFKIIEITAMYGIDSNKLLEIIKNTTNEYTKRI